MPPPGSYQALNAREIRLKKERDKRAKRAAMAKQLADQLAVKKREIENSLNAQNAPEEKERGAGNLGDPDSARAMNMSYLSGQGSSAAMLTQHQLKKIEEAENLQKEQNMNPLVGVPLYDFLLQQEGGFLGAVPRESGSEEGSEEEEYELERVVEQSQNERHETGEEGNEGEKKAAEDNTVVRTVKKVKKEKKRREIDPEAQLEELSNPKELSKIILKITQFEKKDERAEKFEPNFDKLSLFLKYKKRTTKKVTDPYELLNSTSAKLQKAQAQSQAQAQAQAEAAKAAMRAEAAKLAASAPAVAKPTILMHKKELKESSPEVADYFQKKRAKMRGTNTNSFNDSERDESMTDPSKTAGNMTFTMGATGSVKRTGRAEKFNGKTPLEPIRGSELAESSHNSSFNHHNESNALRKAKAKSLANQIRRVNQKLPALKDQDSQKHDSGRGRDSSRQLINAGAQVPKKSQSPFRLVNSSQDGGRGSTVAYPGSDPRKKEYQNIYMGEFNSFGNWHATNL